MTTEKALIKFERCGDRIKVWTDEHRERDLTVESAEALAKALLSAVTRGTGEALCEIHETRM